MRLKLEAHGGKARFDLLASFQHRPPGGGDPEAVGRLVEERHPQGPWAGTWNGKEGFGEMMTTLGEHADIELYELDRFVEDGTDRMIVFGRERLRSRTADRLAETAWVHELTIRAGKVTQFVEHYDTDILATALAG